MPLGTLVSPSPILEDNIPWLALPWDAILGCTPTLGDDHRVRGVRGLPMSTPDLPRNPIPALESVPCSGE